MKCSVSSLIQRGDTACVMDSRRAGRSGGVNDLRRIGDDPAKC